MPQEHPYDPKFPVQFPSVAPANEYTGMPVTQAAVDPNAGYNDRSPVKITSNLSLLPPSTAGKGRVTPGPMVPRTLAPTLANQYRLSSRDERGLCPVIQPSGKLALAEEAWNLGKRAGHVVLKAGRGGSGSAEGSVDMGKDGGWYDVETKGCCDHYCREVNYGGVWRWSCIPPQAPNAEYSTVQPRGNQCSTLAGPVISQNLHPSQN
jgi:hypothetical protein